MPPDFAIINEREIDGFRHVEVNTSKATFQGRPWKTLGDFGKKKFENMLVLTRPKERIKVAYINELSAAK